MSDLPPQLKCVIEDPDDISKFKIHVDLAQENNSYWHKGKYVFDIDVPRDYPHKPPKVVLDTPIYHPNIDRQGAVCLNILRKEWKPINTMNMIALGLLFLFHEPEPADPLNLEAAAMMRDNKNKFL